MNRLLLLVGLVLASTPCWADEIAPGRSGPALIEFLRSHYRPARSLTYRQARRVMFAEIDNRGGKVRCVYTGVEVPTSGIPADDLMNTEHTWPQSKFQQRRPMKSDLYHLFPTLSKVNQVRGNLPFADIPDDRTTSWWQSNGGQRTAPSLSERDAFSESTDRSFEPREDHKGNVARAMFYFWVVYGEDDVQPTWVESQLSTLAAWHEADPVDQVEHSRCERIKELQGNENPFVLDKTLVRRVFAPSVNPLAARHIVDRPPQFEQSVRSLQRFPDFKLEYRPPEGEFKGQLFRLSQDYPVELPKIDEATQRILAIPYNENSTGEENWRKYLLAVRGYCFEGNLEVEWQGQDNPVRPWFHVPWQHYGEKGREGIHGLTREASAKPRQLHPNQQGTYQTHAVAMYNARGGYTIGQVWKNQFEPDPTVATFPVGTVVAKILFTQAKSDEVPYLCNPLIWKAFVQDPRDPTKRNVQNLRLLQMDIMVRDDRARATGGWVFGTYCYTGTLAHENHWLNLVPVGIQWGNDPEITAAESNPTALQAATTVFNDRLRQTIINRSPELPAQHLGWGGRLNGPADYFRSSCMSCHETAQYPVVAPQHPDFVPSLDYEAGSPNWMVWFRNLTCGESFSPNASSPKRAHSMDFSLQLAIGIDNFYLWKATTLGGYYTPALPGSTPTSRTETFRPTSEAPASGP